MIEKDIEAAIISALEALALDGLEIHGAWQAAAEGEVKGEEKASDPAAVYVRVSPRTFASNALPEVTIDAALSLVVRADLCPTGTALETYCDPIAALLQDWNLAVFADGSGTHGFDVPAFAVGGIQFAGGSGPEYDRTGKAWSVDFNLTISGVVVPVPDADDLTTTE